MSNRKKLQQFIDDQKGKGVHFYEIEDRDTFFSARVDGASTFSGELFDMIKEYDYTGDVMLRVDIHGRVCATITNDEY